MKRIFWSMICCALLFPHAVIASDFRFSTKPNKAHLIQWRTWGADTLDEARRKNRLILLSLSAVWCHWCHVMDETTYSDNAVIAYINDNFIPVRVDADMRPDIDALYNQGGWPSTAILTPQGEVVSGGNYFPPEEMIALLKRAATLFSNDRSAIEDRLEELKARKQLSDMKQKGLASSPDESGLDRIAQVLENNFDEENGGFGSGQKFPNPDAIDFLIFQYVKNKDESARKVVTKTLDRMARGGIFDQVEGGFFRYATKPDWSEPHYEKMLEVNAGLIKNYAAASQIFNSREYLIVVRRSIGYLQANLYDPASGAFYGSQDADESYYKKHDRKGTKKPYIDKTVYADSSSLMISALISAYSAAGRKQYLHMAVRCADFILLNMVDDSNGVFHAFRAGTPSLGGLLSDNVLFGSSLLDLYNMTGDKHYLDQAIKTGRLVIDRFYDAGVKRFRKSLDVSLVKPVTAGILSEVKDNHANYRAIRFLGRLAFTGDHKGLKEARDAALTALSGEYRKYTPHAGSYGNALLWSVGEPLQITIVAEREGARRYLSMINSVFIPEKAVRVLSMADDAEEIRNLKYPAEEAVYLCAGKRCSKPISTLSQLKAEIMEFMKRKR